MKTKELKKRIIKILNKSNCLSIEPTICPDCEEVEIEIKKLLRDYE